MEALSVAYLVCTPADLQLQLVYHPACHYMYNNIYFFYHNTYFLSQYLYVFYHLLSFSFGISCFSECHVIFQIVARSVMSELTGQWPCKFTIWDLLDWEIRFHWSDFIGITLYVHYSPISSVKVKVTRPLQNDPLQNDPLHNKPLQNYLQVPGRRDYLGDFCTWEWVSTLY